LHYLIMVGFDLFVRRHEFGPTGAQSEWEAVKSTGNITSTSWKQPLVITRVRQEWKRIYQGMNWCATFPRNRYGVRKIEYRPYRTTSWALPPELLHWVQCRYRQFGCTMSRHDWWY
jgi:hypothetical protein